MTDWYGVPVHTSRWQREVCSTNAVLLTSRGMGAGVGRSECDGHGDSLGIGEIKRFWG